MNEPNRITELAAICRKAALSASNPEAVLGAGATLGRLLWANPVGPVEDEALEVALHDRFGASFARAADSAGIEARSVDRLHVISEAFDFGGHTRLLEEILAIQARQGSVAVAVTTSMTARFAERCSEIGAPVHRLNGSLVDRATSLIAIGRRARRVMLHIHPDDLGAAIAARVLSNEGREVVFLNHADHLFGFGHGAATVVAEIGGFGWRLTSERRTARAQHFLGIPAPPLQRPTDDATARTMADGPILSVGSAHKYRPDGSHDFPAFLMTLMSRTDRPVELIGPSPDDPWWQPVLARYGNRLRILSTLPFEATLARLANAACYVDSFPITGGTAMTQGLMAGKTVFAPPYPAGGYSLADALRAPSIQAMTQQILDFLSSGREPTEQSAMRQRIAAEFGTAAFERRLSRLEDGAEDPPPHEMLSAAQDLDYHTDAWRRRGPAVFAVPSHTRPGFATRLALTKQVAGRPGIRRPLLPLLLGWALMGPPASWAISR